MVRALAQGFALEFEPIRVVDQPVQDRVSHRGVGDEFMPLVYRELAGDQGCPLAVIDDFQEVPEGFFGGGSGPKIIDDQQAASGQPFQEGRQAAVGMGRAQGSEQFGAVEEDRAMPIPAGLMAQCACQIGFADAGWSGDQADPYRTLIRSISDTDPDQTGHPSDPIRKLSDISPDDCPTSIGTLSALNRNAVRFASEYAGKPP